MMDGYGSGMYSGPTWVWVVACILLVLAVILAVVLTTALLTRSATQPRGRPDGAESDAERLLRRRFAAGEIDETEFLARLEALAEQPRSVG